MKTQPIEGSREWLVNMIVAAGFLFFCAVVLFAVIAMAASPEVESNATEFYKLRTFERVDKKTGKTILCTVADKIVYYPETNPAISCVVL